MASALERGDVAAASGCYADDAQLLTPGAGLIHGRKAIEEYWRTGIALGLSSVSFEARRVERLGARKVEIGRDRQDRSGCRHPWRVGGFAVRDTELSLAHRRTSQRR